MRRLIAAAVIGVILLTLYFTGYFYVTDTCEKTKDLLKECRIAYDQQNNAEEKAKEINEYWNKKEPMLSIFSSHSKIDDVEEALYCLQIYSNTDEAEIFYEYHGTVEILIHQLLEDTKPGVHSIL